MTRGRRTWHRRAFAATTAVLWLLGVEVLPNLHLATHQHDHTHAVDGSIVQLGHAHEEREAPHVHHRRGHDHPRDHDHAHRAAHAHHAELDDLAALQVAHEHVVIEDELDFIDHLYDEVEHDDHDADAGHVDESTPAERTAAPAQRRGDRTQLAIDQGVAPGHAAFGIAHHATALHKPAPPLLAPVARPNVETWTHAAPNERVASAELARPTARGPPVA